MVHLYGKIGTHQGAHHAGGALSPGICLGIMIPVTVKLFGNSKGIFFAEMHT